MSTFRKVAVSVLETLKSERIGHIVTATDRDAEWQRVNSYVADILKDIHVLYAKLARIQADFTGDELGELEKVSEAILSLGEQISAFSKNFYEGRLDMIEKSHEFGGPSAPQVEQQPVQQPVEQVDVTEVQEPAVESEPVKNYDDIPVEVEEKKPAKKPAKSEK